MAGQPNGHPLSGVADLNLAVTADGVSIAIRARPGASRDAVLGVQDGALRVAISAPPVEGAANDRLVRYIAEILGLPRSAVRLTRGDRGRNKVVTVAAPLEAVRRALDAALEER